MKSAFAFLGGALLGAAAATLLILSSGSKTRPVGAPDANVRQAAPIEPQPKPAATTPHAAAPLFSSATATPTPAEKSNNPAAALASFIDNPAMRTMMAAQQRSMAEENYAGLIAQFRFTPEERAQFLELVAAKEMVGMNYGAKILKAAPEDRKELSEEMQRASEKADDDLRDFFNDDTDFKTYEDYRKQLTQRMELRQLAPLLNDIHQPLNADQEKSLLAIMDEERNAKPPSTATDDSSFNPTDIDRVLERQAGTQKRIAARAAAILTPEQLAVLQQNQSRTLEMMNSGLEMSRALLGTPTPTPPK